MEDFLYAYNQPKKFGKYDLFLDGKITANEIVYKVLTEDNDIENINLADKVKELESRLQTHFTFDDKYETYNELQTAFGEGSLKETVIYIVKNETNSDDPDSRDNYNEYMIVTDKDGNKSLELIGSGSFEKQQADLQAEIDRASAAEKVLTDNLAQEVTERKDGDTALDGKISAEQKRASAAETVLTDNLAQEVIDRTSADTALHEKIVDEKERATEKEEELSARIKTIEDYNINTRVNEIETEFPKEVSRAKEAEEALQSQIATLESTIDSLQKAVVVLELPNCEIHNETVSQEYIVGDESKFVTISIHAQKGTMTVGNVAAIVTVNELQNSMDVTISQFGVLSGSKEIIYTLGQTETIDTSSVTNQDGSTTVTKTTTPYTHKLPITVIVSGGHKTPSVSVSFGDKTEEAGTPTIQIETIPAPQPEEPEIPTESTQ